MKIPKRVTQAFCFINILSLIIGFCSVAGAQDQQTVKRLQQLIEQQQKQLEAQQKALENFLCCLSDQINYLKINEIYAERGVV
jgi:hypothetical protein